MNEKLFISTEQLAEALGSPRLAILDASFFLPAEQRDARAEFAARHIPGAVFFDIDATADHSTSLPHMLPSETDFAAVAGRLGLAEDSRIVVYDNSDLVGAARAWWTLRAFGARDVRILEGGLGKWRKEGRVLERGERLPAPRVFNARLNRRQVASLAETLEASETKAAEIVDARSAGRFTGDAPEPRRGLRSGHIPGSRNVPWTQITKGGRVNSPEDVRYAFAKAGVDLSRPVITTCGSGVTAAILLLALESVGKRDVALYDGSWSEWGGRLDLPVSTGEDV